MLIRNPVTCAAHRAFTMVELTIVIVIVAIITAMGAPKYANAVAHYRVDTAAHRLAADLAAAQSQARATSKPQTVTFNITASSYTIPVKDLTNTYSTTTVNLDSDQYLSTISSVNFNSTTQVTFDIYGKPDNGGAIVLQAGSMTKTVTVDPDSGKASIQ